MYNCYMVNEKYRGQPFVEFLGNSILIGRFEKEEDAKDYCDTLNEDYSIVSESIMQFHHWYIKNE